MKKKDTGATDAQEFSGVPQPPKLVTPLDIQQKEFRVSRFGGYKMRDVDEFLDELTESMSRLTEENQRLRARAGGPGIAAPAADADEASRRAEEIVERARADAARIVREAEDRAAAMSAMSGSDATGGGDRSAVMAFLTREREFLQSMGTLMQQHAEAVKGMARAAKRPRAEPARPERPEAEPSTAGPAKAGPATAPADRPAAPAATDAPAGPPPSEPAGGTSGADTGTTSPQGGSSSQAAPAAPTGPPSRPRDASADEPVRLEDPAPASVAGDDEPRRPRDGSLRELFWGED